MINVAEGGNGIQALEAFEQHRPDVTLTDVRIPGLNGIDAIGDILEKFPNAHVIVLSTYRGDENILRAFQAGAIAYFPQGHHIVDAIRAAFWPARCAIGGRNATRRAHSAHRFEPARDLNPDSRRERQVQ